MSRICFTHIKMSPRVGEVQQILTMHDIQGHNNEGSLILQHLLWHRASTLRLYPKRPVTLISKYKVFYKGSVTSYVLLFLHGLCWSKTRTNNLSVTKSTFWPPSYHSQLKWDERNFASLATLFLWILMRINTYKYFVQWYHLHILQTDHIHIQSNCTYSNRAFRDKDTDKECHTENQHSLACILNLNNIFYYNIIVNIS